MANSTLIPAAQQTPTSRFDWYTFLRNAFINGLKAYGASLMTVSTQEPALNLLKGPTHLGTEDRKAPGAPDPSLLGIGDGNTIKPGAPCLASLETRETNTPRPGPAACPTLFTAQPRMKWETVNPVLDGII
ncbi:hypothetical protein [Occallatibacter savannae]|uniref:hypothetical protein n=1 Tax=Occallatibacter savannae TaxID=1002691 RepID=UPI000D688182|nr:hypothetical protein [Occallatibacter savannae]